ADIAARLPAVNARLVRTMITLPLMSPDRSALTHDLSRADFKFNWARRNATVPLLEMADKADQTGSGFRR
ncbi:MAG: hypothetical protein AAGE89_12895, partial [Pseudomonadota bacterium]